MHPPVFILSPPRSFTSVISAMIGQHPDLYGLPEVNLFAADTLRGLLRWFEFRPRLSHGLLRAVAELGLGAQTAENVATAKAWLNEDPSLPTAALFRDMAAWAGGFGLVDKSPLHVYEERALNRMLDGFPDARFIHLVRHPRSTCESVSNLQTAIRDGGGRTITRELNPDQVWLYPHQRIDSFLSELPSDQHRLIQGESFLAEPGANLTDLCLWLGIAWDQDAVEAMLHPERSPFACLGPRNAPFGTDPSFIRNPSLRKFVPKPTSLEGPVAMPGNPHFSRELTEYAQALGYT
jgi:hypothetical protein